MLDFLRDGAWQGLGAILAVAVTLLVYALQRRRKEFAAGTLSSGELLSVASEVAKRVEVRYNGEKVENLQYVLVGLKNSGNEPILASDFAQPIDIEIQGRGRILSATVNKQKPENLGLKIVVEDWNIKLEPTLWNPGDYATAKVLFAGTSPGPKIHVRIAGIEEVVPLNRGLRFGPREKREFAVDLIKVAAFGVVATVAASRTGASAQAMAWLVAIYCGFVIAIATWAITQGKLTNSQRRYIDDA